ncbi:MAG: DEAD/DEAH box helicase family protein [Candidatus Magasanikbacteria bacterium]
MAINELKKYQEDAIEKIIVKTKDILKLSETLSCDEKVIIFKAPTGSGKTFTMAEYIYQLIKDFEDKRESEMCFLWISIGKGELHKQSYRAIKKIFGPFPSVCLLEEKYFGSRRTIEDNNVVVINWEKLRAKDNQTGEWKNILMKDKETVNFRELIANTKKSGSKIIMIIDESHSGATSERAIEIREIIDADLTIEMSATPVLIEGKHDSRLVEVPASEVIDQGMIKKEIIVNENIDEIADDDITSQDLVLEASYQKRLELAKMYKKENADVNPLVLIQIPTGEQGNEKRKRIEKFLAEKDIALDNGKLAVWLSEEKVNLEVLENNVSEVEFLIFKQAIDTGWDCPRAQILVKFRESHSETFELQTVGRILRMAEAKHYENDNLNKAFIYTNINPDNLGFKGGDLTIKNAIKSIPMKRWDIYKNLKLRSYYRNRVDFGDLTLNFPETLEDVFCDKFEIEKNKFDFNFAEKNKKKLGKIINLDGLEKKEEIILNNKIDAKLFDGLDMEDMIASDNFQAYLSEDDKDALFENLFKRNLNGFAYKRSISIFMGAVFSWFKKYLGITRADYGIIYIQNIILNNIGVFDILLEDSVIRYKPVKDKEIEKKIKEIEQWDEGWEVVESRNFNPETHKPFKYILSLYKRPVENRAYLNFDSEIEKEFIDFLEEHKEKILWWWQNGNEHMALNFGIKYNGGSTFQPDFLVMFKNGKLGVFDTKASGQREDENKLKAEALQKYIKEENKRKKKEIIFGGLVIKEGEHFRINSDEKYIPFKLSTEAREKKAKYKTSSVSAKQEGWKYFEL